MLVNQARWIPQQHKCVVTNTAVVLGTILHTTWQLGQTGNWFYAICEWILMPLSLLGVN